MEPEEASFLGERVGRAGSFRPAPTRTDPLTGKNRYGTQSFRQRAIPAAMDFAGVDPEVLGVPGLHRNIPSPSTTQYDPRREEEELIHRAAMSTATNTDRGVVDPMDFAGVDPDLLGVPRPPAPPGPPPPPPYSSEVSERWRSLVGRDLTPEELETAKGITDHLSPDQWDTFIRDAIGFYGVTATPTGYGPPSEDELMGGYAPTDYFGGPQPQGIYGGATTPTPQERAFAMASLRASARDRGFTGAASPWGPPADPWSYASPVNIRGIGPVSAGIGQLLRRGELPGFTYPWEFGSAPPPHPRDWANMTPLEQEEYQNIVARTGVPWADWSSAYNRLFTPPSVVAEQARARAGTGAGATLMWR